MRSAFVRLIVLSALFASGAGLAGDKKVVSAERAPAESTPLKVAPRMIVTIDSGTGQIRPATAADRAALTAAGGGKALLRAAGTTVVEKFADGRVRATLGPEYLRDFVVCRNPDGTVTYDYLPEGKVDAALNPSFPQVLLPPRRSDAVRSTAFLAVPALLAAKASAATITIVNKDAGGQGLNDPTPATPVGGNPGTTIGQQRLNVLNEAARIWGQILPGSVEIRVDASFQSLSCTASSAILGSSGATRLESDFAGAAQPGVWYVVAEANQLAGHDLEPGSSHIYVTFNSRLGLPGCLSGNGFYYGFDAGQTGGMINLLDVSLFGLAHGLGFMSMADASTGSLCCSTELKPDIFDAFVYDTTKAKSWNQMTSDSERKASAINTGNLVWSGPAANAAGAAYLSKTPALFVTDPPAAAGTMEVGTASFGAALTEAGVSGTLVAALDPSDTAGTLTTDACSPLTNDPDVVGRIALVDRGTCSFDLKASNVQIAGAIGVVVANDTGGVSSITGSDPNIAIPVVMVSQADGTKLRANLPATVKIGLDPARRAGMNAAGQMLLYVPNPVQSGSSISHWDTSARPNLLMEPFINSDLPIGVDITPEALRDLGWLGGPAANFTFTPNPRAGQPVQFADASIGMPTSWFWSFGDGETSSLENPTLSFGAGTYQVSLTASNAIGSGIRMQTIVVSSVGGNVCTSDAYTLCPLGGRYRITSYWKNQYAGGAISALYKTALTSATGAFWLSDSNTFEYLIRINTATDNGRAWIAIPTFTDVEFWITVEDLTNGQSKTYHSLPGNRTLIYDPYYFVFP